MKCLFYAVGKTLLEGGDLMISRSKTLSPLPHFKHMDKRGTISHWTSDDPNRGFWLEFWYTLTNQHYVFRQYNIFKENNNGRIT